MKKAVILYYSCSNNTKQIARIASNAIEDKKWEVLLKPLNASESIQPSKGLDLLVVGVPVHYWDIPQAALKMIQDLPTFQNTYGFVFSTYGNCVCNPVPFHLSKALQAKNIKVLGGAQVLMPHTAHTDHHTRLGDIDTSFGKGEPTQQNLSKLQSALHCVKNKIEARQLPYFDVNKLKSLHTRGPLASLMNIMMTTNMRRQPMPHVLHNKSKCKLCKKCLFVCDAHAIEMSEDKEVTIDKGKCNRCYNCIEQCTEKSLHTDWNRMVSLTRSIHPFAKNTGTRVITV
ncbi:MAG: hypothetical protein GY729_07360 [Desulfobacteraceae bacterium]|nr:hypothetical protein [Desulfobacteraceae bacterium]